MGFLRRMAAILGFVREEEEEEEEHGAGRAGEEDVPRHRPRRGFGVQVPVVVERPKLGPVLVPCGPGEGGIQGFRWYARQLRIDEDGDVGDEFLVEVSPVALGTKEQLAPPTPRFEIKQSTWAAPVKKQTMYLDGNIHQRIEYQGILRWA